MSSHPFESLRFHRDHLWVRPVGQPDEVLIGISDFAQKQLGEIVFVDLPRTGERISLGVSFGVVESSKVVSELVAPLSGIVLETNAELKHAAKLVNEDCYGAGWLMRLKLADLEHVSNLLTSDAYHDLLGGRAK